jgi:hypothetical protein
MGLTHGPNFTEQGPWAASRACPQPLLSSSCFLTEEGRPAFKAKKANIEETNLHTSPHHDMYLTFF